MAFKRSPVRSRLAPLKSSGDRPRGVEDDEYKVSFRLERRIGSYEADDLYLSIVRGAIQRYRDDDRWENVGELIGYRVHIEQAMNAGGNAFDACDAHSQDLLEYAEAVLDPRSGHIRESVSREGFEHDLLILHSIRVKPKHRGRRAGLLAAKAFLDTFVSGCGLVICKPFPLEHAEYQSGLEKMSKREARELENRVSDKIRRLARYWTQLGFCPLEGTEYYVLDPALKQPELAVHARQATR